MKYEFPLDLNNKNSAHTKCLNLIEANSKVLDVGCAVGLLGQYLAQEKNCEVVGIDIVDEFLDEARKKNAYKELFKLNLDTLSNELDKYEGYFDYILMADVIEHTYNNKEILTKLKKLLNQNGRFIMSIPNISHGSIKLSLLANTFRYTEMGLLDSTHIRFFTRETIINLMTDLNLQITDEDFVVYTPNDVCHEPKNLIKYNSGILKFVYNDPYSYIYQFILSAKPSDCVDNTSKLLCDIKNFKILSAIKNYKKNRNKQIIDYMKRKPLFLFRKEFWNLLKN